MLSVSIIRIFGGACMPAAIAAGAAVAPWPVIEPAPVVGGALAVCARRDPEAANAREIAASAGRRHRFMRTHLRGGKFLLQNCCRAESSDSARSYLYRCVSGNTAY